MNQNIQDPSKIGTSGLRGLNYSGNNIYNNPSDYFLNYEPPRSRPRVVTTASKDALNKHIERANRNMAETPMVSYGYAEGFGNSQYDDEIKTLSQLENLENFRSQAQSATGQFFNGLGKAAVLTGTTFLDGIIGTIWGIGTAALEGRWSGLWDNGFSKAMNGINEWSEGVMANYYTDAQKESPWYSSENLLSMNFWSDKVLKNAGFTAGAILTGVTTGNTLSATGALKRIGTMASKLGPNAAAKAPGIISAALGSTLSGAAESRMQAIQATDEWEKEQIAELDSKINTALAPLDEEYNRKLQEYNNRLEYDRQEQINAERGIIKIEPYTGEDLSSEQLIKLKSNDPQMYNEIMSARAIKYRTANVIAEELTEVKNRYTQAQAEQAGIRDVMLNKIKEQKLKMGNQDFSTNLVLTTGADYIQFGRFFSGGYKTGRRVVKELSRSQKWGRTIYAGTKGPIAEGSQEMSQDMTDNILGDYHSSIVNDFYNSRYNPEGEQNTADFVNSFTKMFSETLVSNESQEAAFIGALTGFMGGIPLRSPIKKGGGFQSPITFERGTIGEVKEELRKQREAQELIDSFNARKNSGNMKEYYQGLVRHRKYGDDMDEAVSVGDIFNYKNAEHAQLVSDIVMFDKVGRLDELTAMVNGALEITDENLAAIVQNTSKEENGKTIGPYIDENGTPKFVTEQGKAEMIKELNQKREQILSTIDSYLQNKNKIDAATGYNLTSNQLEELTYMGTQLKNWEERAKSMSEKVNTYIDDVLKPLQEEREDTNKRLEDVNTKLEEGANNDQLLEDGETPFMDTDAGKELVQEKIELTKLLESNKLAINSLEELKKQDSGKKSQALGNLGTRISLIGQLNDLYNEGKIDKIELDERVSTITDLGAIGVAKVNYLVKYNEYLNSPEVLSKNTSDAKSRFEKQKIQKATQSVRTALAEYKDFGSFREGIDKLVTDGISGKTLEDAVTIMTNEGNSNAKAYQEYTNTYRDVERQLNKILDEAGATDSQKSDARQMLAIHGNTAQSLDELLNSNTDMNRYISSIDEQINANSPTTPSYLVKKAIDEVKNKRKSNKEFKKDKTRGKGAKVDKKSGKDVRENRRNKNKSKEGSMEEFVEGQEEDKRQSNGEEEFNGSRRNRNTTSTTSKQTDSIDTQAEQNTQNETQSNEETGNLETEQGAREESQSPVSDNNNSDLPIGGKVSKDEAVGELEEYNKEVQEKREREIEKEKNPVAGGDKRKWYRPAIPEVHLEESNESNPRPFNIAAKEREGKDFDNIYNYLKDKGAFKYVNSGKLKVGDTIYFVVDPEFIDYKDETGTTIFMVVKDSKGNYQIGNDNYQVINALDSSSYSVERFAGLEELSSEVFEQYKNRENKEGIFIADGVTVKVDSVIGGNINYTQENRSVSQISGDSKTVVPKLAIMTSKGLVAPGVDLSGVNIEVYYKDKEGKERSREGRVYLLIPNGAGGYVPIPARVKHFNEKEGDFSIDNQTPRGQNINKAIDDIVKVVIENGNDLDQEKLTELVQNLDKYIYLGDVLLTTFSGNTGQGIKVTIFKRDQDGNYIYNKKTNEREEEQKLIYINNQDDSAKSEEEEEVKEGLVKALYSANPPIQISTEDINTTSGYNKELIESDVMTVNVNSFDVYNTFFKTSTYSPASSKPASPSNTKVSSTSPASPVGGNDTMSSNSNFIGIPITIDGRKTTVDLDNLKVEKNGKVHKIDSNTKTGTDEFRAYCTALADSIFKKETKGRNLVGNICILEINGKEYIFNRNTKKVLTSKSARQKIEEYNKKIDQTIAEGTKNENSSQTTESHNTQVGESQDNTSTTTTTNSSENTESINTELENDLEDLDSDDMLFREVDSTIKNDNEASTLDEELAWLDRALPQVSKEERLQVRDGLIQASRGREAWGAFTGSMVIISDQAANGTVYHEAFHTVFHTALSEKDRLGIYSEARTLYGDLTRLELEENMAEDFRVWMQSGAKDTRSFGKKILDYFKSLSSFIGLRPSLMSYYVNINKGKYANRNLNFSDSNTNTADSLEREVIQEQEEANRKRNEYYSNVKFLELTAEQRRDLVKGSGWTEESFNRASAIEKEVALHCAGI